MKKLTHLNIVTFLALTLGLMLSCAEKKDPPEEDTSTAVTVSGQVQKGPYVQGTEITVRELDSTMTPTGNTFTGTIDDNTGSFSVKGTLTNKMVELSAIGYYFNEVSGSLSNATLTLSALSDLTDSSTVNVNLMTHLEKKRVEYLMDNSKMTFAAAKTQAQGEILKMFNIDNVTLGNSETLDIAKDGDQNAILLAISAILQDNRTEAELTELLSNISTDLRQDGTLDSSSTNSSLTASAAAVNLETVRTNVTNRYSDLGVTVTVPKFEEWIDKDGSKLLPRRELEVSGITFVDNSTANFMDNVSSNTISLTGIDSGVYIRVEAGTGITIVRNGSDLSGSHTTAQNGDTFQLKVTAPEFSATTNSTIKIGSNSYTWSVTSRKPTINYHCVSGWSVPQSATNTFFAVPIIPTVAFIPRFGGIGVGSGGFPYPTPSKFSIYSNNSGVPGSELQSTTTFTSWVFSGSFTKYDNSTTSSFTSPQFKFDNPTVTLSANTTYWMVVEYDSSSTPALNQAGCTNSTSLKRKMSSDGTNWVDWRSTSNGNSDNANASLLPGHFLSD